MTLAAKSEPWEARDPRAPLRLTMTFEGDALVLGAGTRIGLAKRGMSLRKIRDEAFDEPRVATLLAVAHGHEVDPSAFRYICGALEKQSEGETALALVYLALANLPKLQRPTEAAWRLSAADRLMSGGMAPSELVRVLGLAQDHANIVSRAFNPDQARVPAGSGPESGRWTNGSVGGDAAAGNSPSPSSASDRSPDDVARPIRVAMNEEDEDSEEREERLDPQAPGLYEKLEADMWENGHTDVFAGISVFGTARLTNRVATYEIGMLYAPEDQPQNLFKFVKEMESVASDLGANSLEIYGFGIVNSRLFDPSIATRLGYKYELLDSGRVIRLSKNLFRAD